MNRCKCERAWGKPGHTWNGDGGGSVSGRGAVVHGEEARLETTPEKRETDTFIPRRAGIQRQPLPCYPSDRVHAGTQTYRFNHPGNLIPHLICQKLAPAIRLRASANPRCGPGHVPEDV